MHTVFRRKIHDTQCFVIKRAVLSKVKYLFDIIHEPDISHHIYKDVLPGRVPVFLSVT